MLLMRIGGDEFAPITGLYNIDETKALSTAVLSLNDQPVMFEGKSLPLSLWCGITVIPESLRYSEFFTDMHKSISDSKN